MEKIAFIAGGSSAIEYYSGLPIYLYGHSLGGNLVLNFVLRRKPDLKGVIATDAWLKMAYEPAAYQYMIDWLDKH